MANLATCPTVPRLRAGQMGQSVSISIKALALSVLAASKPVPGSKSPGTAPGTPAALERESQVHQKVQYAACGSPDCAGCYDVGDGRKIHPPKCGEDYRAWLERWEAKGKPQ